MGVPAAFLARDAVAACYAVGRGTGTVVDVGHSGTVVSPVYEGYVENRGVLRSGPGAGGAAEDESVLELLDAAVRDDRARRRRQMKMGRYEWVGWRDDVPTAMPLYQCRARRADKGGVGGGGEGGASSTPTRRSDLLHRLSRLEMARDCKEEGSGAATGPFGFVRVPPPPSSSSKSNSDRDGGGGEASSSFYAESAAAQHGLSDESRRVRSLFENAPGSNYSLPDGTLLEISQLSRRNVGEALFGTDAISSRRREEGVSEVRSGLDEILTASAVAASGPSAGGGGPRRLPRSGTNRTRPPDRP